MPVTLVRNAAWAVAFDGQKHLYRRDCDVAFDGDRIVHVGPGFAGEAARTIDGRGLMVMPGLVNIHSHPASEPFNKGWNDEIGSAKLYGSSLYEFMPLFRPDAEGAKAAATVAYCELLLSGVTTLVDLSVAWPGWLDLLGKSGLRGIVAPMYRSARWSTSNGHVVDYHWDEDAGRKAMEEALRLCDEAARHPSGRLSGMVAPAQIDTCTADLIRDSFAAAQERGLPFQIHAAQSVVEFHEITRRHGATPVEWLQSLGVLSERSIVGHGIFLDHHPGAGTWPKRDDLATLAATRTTVAHCPVVFQRRGIAMKSLGRYLARGVRMGVGTDTYPHNMLEEMRAALITSRLMSENVWDLRTTDVFDAATLGGARALGRTDVGRLAVDAKADIVLVDLRHFAMRPVRDPVRSLVYTAAERAVRTVFVNGEAVVEDGRVTTLDHDGAAAALEEAQRRVEGGVASLDWAKRDHAEISPYTFPVA
jgi:5-methylthioadenosine/S-adenosylhomocysteine deaminase